MDAPDADPDRLRRSPPRSSGMSMSLWIHPRNPLAISSDSAPSWKPRGQAIRILDVATGSADVPKAILRWASRAGFDVRIVRYRSCTRRTVAEAAAGNMDSDRLRRPCGCDVPSFCRRRLSTMR